MELNKKEEKYIRLKYAKSRIELQKLHSHMRREEDRPCPKRDTASSINRYKENMYQREA